MAEVFRRSTPPDSNGEGEKGKRGADRGSGHAEHKGELRLDLNKLEVGVRVLFAVKQLLFDD